MSLRDLSVVIPVFNKARELQICLDLLKKQSLPKNRWEVVIVDDGSTDESASVANTICQSLTATVISLDGQARGAARARNVGARSANGKILVFLDPDVLPCRVLLRAHLATLSSNSRRVSLGYMYAVGYGPSDFHKEFGSDFDFAQLEASISRANSIPLLQDCRRCWADSRNGFETLPCPWAGCWSGNLAVWADEFFEAGGFDEEFRDRGAEDIELGYRLHSRGVSFQFNEEAQGFHFPHPIDDSRCQELDTTHYRQFLQKHPALEVELIAAFSCSEVNEAVRRLSQVLPLRHDPALAWEGLLQLTARIAPPGARVCFLGALPPCSPPLEMGSVALLGISEWLLNLGSTAQKGNKSGLLGMATPFAFREFDVAIFLDAWTILPTVMSEIMLLECARISRTLFCVASSIVNPVEHGMPCKMFEDWVLDERCVAPPIRGIRAVFSAVTTKEVYKEVQINLDGLDLGQNRSAESCQSILR